MYNLTSPIHDAYVGESDSVFSVVNDTAPFPNGKQWAVNDVSVVGFASVVPHSIAFPFTHTFIKPSVLKVAAKPNAITGVTPSVPKNKYKVVTRKGTKVNSTTNSMILVESYITIPAGAENYSPGDVKAALQLHQGALDQQLSGVADVCITGLF